MCVMFVPRMSRRRRLVLNGVVAEVWQEEHHVSYVGHLQTIDTTICSTSSWRGEHYHEAELVRQLLGVTTDSQGLAAYDPTKSACDSACTSTRDPRLPLLPVKTVHSLMCVRVKPDLHMTSSGLHHTPHNALLWSCEVGAVSRRVPDSLPGLTRHYTPAPGPDSADSPCEIISESPSSLSSSSSSSSTSSSPGGYRRLERAPLIRRLGLGRILQHDDDQMPLVTDTPTTPTSPLCVNGSGGYINEGTEVDSRTRDSNHDPRHNDLGTFHTHPRLTHSETSNNDRNVDCLDGPMGNNNRPLSEISLAEVSRLEPNLVNAPWFQAGIPREIALEVLRGAAEGSFLVRGAASPAGALALSLRVPSSFSRGGLAHYLIQRTHKGYRIKGFTKEFSTLTSLVTHHSVMPELLPVPLRLPRYSYHHQTHNNL